MPSLLRRLHCVRYLAAWCPFVSCRCPCLGGHARRWVPGHQQATQSRHHLSEPDDVLPHTHPLEIVCESCLVYNAGLLPSCKYTKAKLPPPLLPISCPSPTSILQPYPRLRGQTFELILYGANCLLAIEYSVPRFCVGSSIITLDSSRCCSTLALWTRLATILNRNGR